MADINKLIDELGKLTLQEAADMAKMMEEKWGIQASNIQAGAPQAAAPVEAKATLSVILTGFDESKKIMVLKKCREHKEMGLLDAKKFVESCPGTLKEDIDKDEAEKIKQELEAIGGKVELK